MRADGSWSPNHALVLSLDMLRKKASKPLARLHIREN
jgi:hypothetical protein